ncbi:DUF1569 domain-containing protein [Croceimicrobium sp.]|uniref:DUF1569 domain-containing protein n=1 Tax=Croceimicrobium sp. TaxID=2828340 RepID=UPI003BA9DAE2
MKELQRYLLLEFPVKLKALKARSKRQFGEMSVIEMLDHLRKAFLLSYNETQAEITSPEEQLPKLQAFLASDKPIRPGAKAPKVYGEIPANKEDFEEMKYLLLKEMVAMLAYFDKHPDFTKVHPIFGELNVEQWLQMHKKHTEHHLRQFGIE